MMMFRRRVRPVSFYVILPARIQKQGVYRFPDTRFDVLNNVPVRLGYGGLDAYRYGSWCVSFGNNQQSRHLRIRHTPAQLLALPLGTG